MGAALAAAVRRGEVDEDMLDDRPRRILRLAARVGALASPDAQDRARELRSPPQLPGSRPGSRRRSSAARPPTSFVLLANDGILPLHVGRSAPRGRRRPERGRALHPGRWRRPHSHSLRRHPARGLRAALPAGVEIVHEPGGGTELFLPALALMDVQT